MHIQPGQKSAVQRYPGIVEPAGREAEYSIIGSLQQPANRGQASGVQQPQRRAPQLQNRIARALSNIAGRGGSQQAAQPIPTQSIPQYNQQSAPIERIRTASYQGPQTYRSDTPIGTGVRSFNANHQPLQVVERQTNSQFNHQRRAVHNHQRVAHTQHQERRHYDNQQRRQFPVQPIKAAELPPQQFNSAQSIATAPTYYDRPDIQATSAQQLDDEIYIEDVADFHVAQTPAQLPSLQDSQFQAEPVSVLNTSPEASRNGYSNNYQDPTPSDFGTDIQPNIPAQENDLRIQNPEQQNVEDFARQDDLDDRLENPFERPCDEMRNDLLNRPITEIALDISPLRSTNATEYRPQHRTWTDQFGREIASGIITAVRRGYVIVENNGTTQRIPYGNLSDPDLDVVARFWQIPKECRVSQDVFLGRSWAPQTITWKASNLCHKPLYFENVQLERYGHSHGPFSQPVRSTVHFFSNLLLLPYNTGINPPNECRYALGYYRPGNCAPWLKDPFPISLAGTQRQVAAMTGTGFLIIP